MENNEQKINLDDKTYNVSEFGPGIQQAVSIYNKFNTELAEARLEVVKLESALSAIAAQITEAVKKEVAAKGAAPVEQKAAKPAKTPRVPKAK